MSIKEKIKPRAKPHYGTDATHRTETTRKYQANAPISWEKALRALAKEKGYKREGEAIREALYAGLKALKLSPEDYRQESLPLAKAPKKEKPAAKAPKAAKPAAAKAEG